MKRKLQSSKSSARKYDFLMRVITVIVAVPVLTMLFGICDAIAQVAPQIQWLKSYAGEGSDNVSDFILEDDGGYLLAGYSDSDTSATKEGLPKGGFDYWIIRTDKDGNRLWDKTYGGASDDELKAIVKTSDGGYLLVGNSNSPAGGDKTAPFKSTSPEDKDIWVVKISASGAKLWDSSFGGDLNDLAASVIGAGDGGFLVFGSSNSPISGDKSESTRPGTEYRSTSSGSVLIPAHDFWLVKVSATGAKLWDRTYGGLGTTTGTAGIETGSEIVAVPEGGFMLAGTSNSVIGNERSSYSRGEKDYWMVKVTDTGAQEWDKAFGGNYDDELTGGIEVLPDGYLIGGTSSSEISGDKTEDTYRQAAKNCWLLKISKSGIKIWDHLYGKYANGFSLEAMTATERGIYVSGMTNFYDPFIEFGSWDYSSYWSVNLYDRAGITSTTSGAIKLGSNHEVLLAQSAYGSFGLSGLNVTFIKFRPEVYYQTDPIAIGYDAYDNINALKTSTTPSDIVKVEFYIDSMKIGEKPTVPSRINVPFGVISGAHYLSLKATTASGSVIKSRTLVITRHTPPFAQLYKAVNLNGPDVKLDENLTFTGSNNVQGFWYEARAFSNQSVPLTPQPDTALARVIRSSFYATKAAPAYFTFSDVPLGTYEVYLYVWEDNNAQTFTLSINGSVVLSNLNTGAKGNWAKVGPFKTFIDSGKIEIKAEGGDANISAIEIYKIAGFKLYRALNLNGPALSIDNLPYESSRNAADFSYQAKMFENQSVPLNFPTDAARAKMIRSSLYSTKTTPATFTFKNVPPNRYAVYAYIWEDNYSQTFTINVNNITFPRTFTSGTKGSWTFVELNGYVDLTETGNIEIVAQGGDANISGIEIWQYREGPVAATASSLISPESKSAAFPNPIQKELYVNLPATYKGKATFTIYDMYGKIYVEKTKEITGVKDTVLELPLEKMKAGIYFLKTEYDNTSKIVRLNKE